MPDYMVIAKNLTKRFGKITAVDHLNLEIRCGEVYSLLGPNGAGKTTTIRMLVGLLLPDEGEIYIDGIDAIKYPQKIKRIIGYMPQFFSLYPDLTVYENMEFFARIYNLPYHVKRERIRYLLELVQLWEHRDKLAGALSGGLKKRLSLAVVLLHDPKLIILDEPTAGVDPPLRRLFWRYFRQLQKEGKTILVTTHYMDEAELADRIGLMSRGRLIAVGTPREIKRMVYNGDVMRIVARTEKVEKILNNCSFIRRILSKRKLADKIEYKIVVNDFSLAVPRLATKLKDLALLIEPVNITLEDAFIKLTVGEKALGWGK